MVLPERTPSSPEPKKTVRRDFKIVPDILSEEKITEERDKKIEKKSTKGGGGKRRVIKIVAGAGIPLVASAAAAFGLEKAGVIDIIPNEQEPSGDHLTEDKDGNVIAVIGNQEAQKETLFSGLEIEGLETVFQNDRWEYVDQNDGLIAGYWNEEKGRYEHTAEVLKGEWSGLFVNAVERNEEIKASLKENEDWTVKRWEEGKIKMPIPFELSSETEIEERSAVGAVQVGRLPKVLLVSNLPSGTIVFTYFSEEGYNLSLGMPMTVYPCTFDMTRDQLQIGIWYKRLEQRIPKEEIESEEVPRKFGDPLLKVEESDVLARESLILINPILREKYQLVFTATDMASSGLPIDFSFKNLLKDKEGRFVYLNSAYASFYSNNE